MFYKEFTKNSRMLCLNKNKIYFISKNKGNLIPKLTQEKRNDKNSQIELLFFFPYE